MLGANPGGWVFTQSPDIGLNRVGPFKAASMGNTLWGLRTKGQDPSTWAWEWREVLGNGVQEVELVRSFYPVRQSFLGNILAQVKIAFFPSRTSGLLRSWITHSRTHLGPGTLPPTPGGLFPVPSTALISELVPRAKRRDSRADAHQPYFLEMGVSPPLPKPGPAVTKPRQSNSSRLTVTVNSPGGTLCL